MKNFFFLMSITILMCSCASSPAIRVSDAESVDSVSAIGMTCNKPFRLTQDCSIWSGPTKKISFGNDNELSIKVAGNAEGTITVVFGKKGISSTKATAATNLAYDLLKRKLISKGFTIIKVTPIESAGTMFGYAIETSESSYHIWDEYAVE